MAEVSKRDAQAALLNKLVGRIMRLPNDSTHADVTVFNRELDAVWARYQKLHELVMDRTGSAEVAEQTEVFNTVYDAYMAASANICRLQTLTAAAQASHKVPAAHQQPHHAIARIIVNIEHRLAERLEDLSVAIAAPQLKTLEDLYRKYQTSLVAVLTTATDSEAAKIIEQQDAISNSYLRTEALLKQVIVPDAAPPATHQVDELKVPAIQIGTFDGTPSKWESFRESFDQVFHVRESMPAVQKLQHLKGCLRGEAEELISNFSLTNDNYNAA